MTNALITFLAIHQVFVGSGKIKNVMAIKKKTVTQTLNTGVNTVTHSLSALAKVVSVLNNATQHAGVPWKRNTADPTNKIDIDMGGSSLVNAEINIVAWN